MLKQHKVQWFGDERDKIIVTFNLQINRSKDFNALDDEGRNKLIAAAEDFKEHLEDWILKVKQLNNEYCDCGYAAINGICTGCNKPKKLHN